MIINEKILKQYLSVDKYNLNELQFLINNHITEIDKCEIVEPNNHLIIGQIIKFDKMTNSDKLSLVTINIKNKHLQIICGASNLEIGKKVIVATIGAYLKSIKTHIQKKFILGKESEGMICSARELDLNEAFLTEKEKQGILILDDDAPIGDNALEYLNLKGFSLKLSITPDRGDLLSYLGFCKDLRAVCALKQLNFSFLLNPQMPKIENPFQIEINNKNCWEYNILYIENVKIQESPLWLRSILFTHNITPVNNIVDITNLILIEYGIPLDIFDASELKDKKIEIRNAFDKEVIYVNDNKTITLNKEDLIVSSGQNILSVFGVFNSFAENINKKTNKIIIISSYINPSYILKNYIKSTIENEKILRWSRGIDYSLTVVALNKAQDLLKQLNKEIITSNIVSKKIKNKLNPEILLTVEFIKNKIGFDLSLNEIEIYLKRLEYEVQMIDNDMLKVKAPSRRYDVTIPEDVCSDIIRLYGISCLKTSDVKKNKANLRDKKQETLYKIKDLLVNLGFYEIITYSLVDLKILNLFPHNKDYIEVAKPISQENTILRQHLSGNMIETLSYNQKHNNYDNPFFEIGKVYNFQEEKLHLALGLSGNLNSLGWIKPNIVSSFFVLKGVLDKIGLLLGYRFDLRQTTNYLNFHPGKQADIFYKDKKMGFIGEIHPSLRELYHLKESFLLEITLDGDFLNNSKKINFKEITKLPSIERDLSFFVSKKYSFQEIFKTLKEESPDILIKCELLDLYEENKLSLEEHSLSFRFTFNDKKQSLSKEVVNQIMKNIENKIIKIYKVKLR
ncbi:MAG: phenylalanine--tRNA ligase subunit beta [Phytoplasma sp.]|uniref:phenylalanine--tRNA ligase subunit beta n=1 Tax=Phytoplasma sp. TaxID=2155 RepID=UPI002B400EC1|nr:phenylalanine--tRNA ligase subunit beta [Phytoplasma sp.]WRH06612.1 MAG: phenylalanine--tRNA ligase subunit beta [Phytoplasma sp.]